MNIILGITGSIAACKAPSIISSLVSAGHNIKVVLTKQGKKFITPLTCRALSGNIVYQDFETADSSNQMDHIALARWCDLLLVAPASANCLSSFAHGAANDLLSTLFLATKAKIWLAPAMNTQMWNNPITQKNIQTLKSFGANIIQPNTGKLACGEFGAGRMQEPETIVNIIDSKKRSILTNKDILITVGPTREKIDPIRYLTNKSSGKMGYAIAQAAINYGANVTCISGPCSINPPPGANIISVESAAEMHQAVINNLNNKDWFIGCAAVADFTPKNYSQSKIKKYNQMHKIELTNTTDIILDVTKSINRPKVVIGFAAETEELLKNAKEKLISKGCDAIIANIVDGKMTGMQSDYNKVSIITKDEIIKLKPDLKTNIADKIINVLTSKVNNEIH